ncbi:MAG: hypothetical protein A2W23_07610 [Planctomycetes bacterium RBG_16_43_13]|nr:MAG: hypothetical protein A2W23_07610 [Planctomycetes bacterium RBG_16_43_13]
MNIPMLAYCRVSTDKQAEEGMSLAAQSEQIAKYAGLYDLEIIETIIDDGYSASNLDRPGLKQVFSMLDAGKVQGVIITKLDRLTRSVFDLSYLLKNYMDKYRFMSVYDKFDTDTAGGRMILSILTTVSQWEREVISERTKAVLSHKKSKGERVGNIPYGKKLSSDGVHLEPDNVEQKIISTIKSMRAEGMTYDRISKAFTYNNRTGKPFTISAIHRIANI